MKKNLKYIIVGLVMVGLILGFYFYLNNKRNVDNVEETTTGCYEAQKLISKNLEKNYPPTPKEVVKLYADMVVVLYSEDYSDEEYEKLALKMRELFDDEFNDANPEAQYLVNLRKEIDGYRNEGVKISSYSTSSSTDVDFFTADGFNFARLGLKLTLKQGTSVELSKETFLLRKDIKGHYKIYGWVKDTTDD